MNPDNELPADFEPCGTCGYDHAYEYSLAKAEIDQRHIEAGELPDDFDVRENDCAD